MAQVPLTFTLNGQTITGFIEVPTARIPELSAKILPYDANDEIALFDYSRNKTVNTLIKDFREYVIGGDNAPGSTPILAGDMIEIPITQALAGSNRVVVLALAGKAFTLERRGPGMLSTNEYNALPTGGFELKDRDANDNPVTVGSGTTDNVRLGEMFFARIYELSTSQNTTTVSSFINGVANITGNIELTNIHFYKLINVIGNSSKVTITLPDITDASPTSLIIPFETNISNQFQTRIATKNGQSIYFGNTSQTEIYLGISESLWLLAGNDGWYVMKASDNLLNVGQPILDYAQRLNTVVGKGQPANRADYPRILKFLNDNPSVWVTEVQWQSSLPIYPGASEVYYPYKGCFSRGDDTTTFRFPDLQELAFAGLKNIGFTDSDRAGNNNPGIVQPDMLRSHKHDINYGNQGSDGTANAQVIRQSAGDNSEGNGTGKNTYAVDVWGQSKTTMKNVGLLPLIRI